MMKTAYVITMTLLGTVTATPDISSFLFPPNLNPDASLLEHAGRLSVRNPSITLEDTSIGVEIDLCDPESFDELFKELAYRPEKYTRYQGLDHTALFASSVVLSDKYAVVGSNGYDVFKGIVHVYVPKTASKWSLQALIRSPVWDNGNFGNDVAVDDERLIIAANAFERYDGVVFIYEHNLEHDCWLLRDTIYSPLASGPDRAISQGFGYRVDLSKDFFIASTSQNNAFIYRETSGGKWALHTSLESPEPMSFFGRAVAIEDDFAVVGAYGFERNVGRVFVYKYNRSADSWDMFDELSPPRNQSNFGFSVAMHNGSLIVGANGFVENQFENHAAFDSRLTQTNNNPGWAYIYHMAPDGSGYLLDEVLESPVGNNSYFGSGVGIHDNKVIVGADGYPCHGLKGAAFVYNKGPNGWTLNQSYPSPAGKEGHFGYAVAINSNVTAIGAYGFDEIRGSIYLAELLVEEVAFIPYPTAPPTEKATDPAEALSDGGLTSEVGDTGLSLGLMLALALGALIVAATAGLIIYCCCCMVPIIPLVKKKKKKEEEDSPYTVHSYAGYTEEEEYMPVMPMIPPPPPVLIIEQDEAIKKKEKEKSVKFMEDGQLREMFPYKVYGPRGYVEETNDVDEDMLIKKKENEGGMADIYPLKKAEEEEEENSDFEFDNTPAVRSSHRQQEHRTTRPAYEHDGGSFSGESGGGRISLVEQARRSAQGYRTHQESQYSMYSDMSQDQEQSSGKSHGASMSSLSNSYPITGSYSSAQRSVSTLSDHKTSSMDSDSRTPSFVDDVDDDATAVSERSDLTSRGRASLVQQARSKYQREYSRLDHVFDTTTRTVQHETSARAKYESIRRSRDLQGNDDKSLVSGSTLSDSAVSHEQPAQTHSLAGTQDASMVELARSRYLSTTSATGSSLVHTAKERYHSIKSQTSGREGEVDDDDATVTSRTTLSSGRSAVEEARAKYARIKREQAATSSATLSGESAGPPSLVEGIQAKYRTMRDSLAAESDSAYSESLVGDAKARYASMSRSTDVDDNASVATYSTGSSSQSLVEAAKAKYAALKKSRADSSRGGDSEDPASTVGSSLVEGAKKRYERLKRGDSLMSDSSAARSVVSSSQQSAASSYTGTGPGTEGGEPSSSYMLAAKARYSSIQSHASSSSASAYSASSYSTNTKSQFQSDTSSQQGDSAASAYTHSTMPGPSDRSVSSYDQRTLGGSVYTRDGGGSRMDHSLYSSSGIAAMSEGDDASSRSSSIIQEEQSKTSESSSASKVDVARQAAMSKFALYKAKAEEEVRLRAQELDTTMGVLVAERGSPLKKKAQAPATRAADWNLDSAVEDTRVSAEKMEISAEKGSEESEESQRLREREETKLRAQAKAREKFAKAKELAAQSAQSTSANAGGSGNVRAEDEAMRAAVEEARNKLRRSAEASAAPIPETSSLPLPLPSSVSTSVKRSHTSATTVNRSETVQHSVQSSSQSTHTREVQVQKQQQGRPSTSTSDSSEA